MQKYKNASEDRVKINRSIRVWRRKKKSKKEKKRKKETCIWMKPNKIMGKIQ